MTTPTAPSQQTPDSKTSLIPTIPSTVFEGLAERFAVGEVVLTDASSESFRPEFAGAAQLRAKTYLDKGFVREEELDEDGTELDADDRRSVHFVVLERAEEGFARVIGNMRLVVKDERRPEPLPMERYYPELFGSAPLPLGSIEVSRLIARHESPRVQNWVKWPLFIAGFKYLTSVGLDQAVHGLLEPRLTRGLVAQQVPVRPLIEAKYIEEINATKQPVEIDMPRLGQVIQVAGDQGIDLAVLSAGGFSPLDAPAPPRARE